jgi:DNA-directed RNA polymerase specialized sigma24 family protein
MTLYKIIRKRHSIEHPESLMVWVHRVLMNVYIDQKRRSRRETPFSRLAGKTDPCFDDMEERCVENYVLGAEDVTKKCFERLTNVLSPMEKNVLDLTSVQGLVSKDVCAALGLTPNKVAKAKMRAKEKMKEAAKLSDIPPSWIS